MHGEAGPSGGPVDPAPGRVPRERLGVAQSRDVPVTKAFRTRAQAERFADLVGEFADVEVPALWIAGWRRFDRSRFTEPDFWMIGYTLMKVFLFYFFNGFTTFIPS